MSFDHILRINVYLSLMQQHSYQGKGKMILLVKMDFGQNIFCHGCKLINEFNKKYPALHKCHTPLESTGVSFRSACIVDQKLNSDLAFPRLPLIVFSQLISKIS